MKIFDLIIIGGGPIGIACAIEAQKKHLSYLIIEKGTIANSIYHYPLYMRFFSTADLLEIDNVPFITTDNKPGRKDALEYFQALVRTRDLHINLYEKMLSIEKEENFTVTTTKATYQAQNVILATGFYDIPNLIGVKGENLPKVKHYYSEPYPYTGQKVVVVGASNSSVDAALEVWRKGGEVTMLVRGNAIGERVKYWIKPDIENRIAEGSIKAYFGANLTEITDKTVQISHKGQLKTLANDFVLALTGYLPNFEMLKAAGIALEGPQLLPQHNTNTMETNVPGLYLAGVVCGGKQTHLWFIENSKIHAQKIIAHITQES